MARGFNLTAEINLRGPSNLRQVVSNLRRQLGSINTTVNVQINQQTNRQITTINSAFQNLNRTLQQTQAISASVSNSLGQLGNASRGLSNNLQNIPQTMNQVAQGANQVAAVTSRASASVRGTSSEFAEFGRQSALAVRRFAAFATVTGVIYKVSNAITSATKDFIDFNQQLIKVAQVTDTPVKSLDFLVTRITDLSTGLGVASQDLIGVSQTLAQAGLNARDTSIALQALARSALAPSFDNLNNTVEGSIALMRQFGIGANQLEAALGSVNAVAAKFAVEAGDIITAISRTGGVFAAASKGVSEGTDALNEFIAVFTSVRATTRESAETIATGLRTIFTRIQRGETIDALKAYGVALTDLEGKFVGPYEATRRLAEGLSRLDPRDIRFSRIVEELGGFRQIGKVIPLIQQFTTAQQALTVAQQGQGSLARDAATAQLSLANQIAKVREEFSALVRSIGQSQGFQDLVRLGLDLASAFIKVADAVKGALPALTAIFAIKGFQALTQFSRGFVGGIRGGGQRTLQNGGYVHHFARGGVVPGAGNTDSVPAMLTPGEFVMNKRAVNKYGRGNLVRMNKYARGGYAGDNSYQFTHLDPGPTFDITYRGQERKGARGLSSIGIMLPAVVNQMLAGNKNKISEISQEDLISLINQQSPEELFSNQLQLGKFRRGAGTFPGGTKNPSFNMLKDPQNLQRLKVAILNATRRLPDTITRDPDLYVLGEALNREAQNIDASLAEQFASVREFQYDLTAEERKGGRRSKGRGRITSRRPLPSTFNKIPGSSIDYFLDGGWVQRMKKQDKKVLKKDLEALKSAMMFAGDTGAYIESYDGSGKKEMVDPQELKERYRSMSDFVLGKKSTTRSALKPAGGYNQEELLDAVTYYQSGSGPLARAMVNKDFIFIDRKEEYSTEDVENRLKAAAQYKLPKKLYSGLGRGQFGEILKDSQIDEQSFAKNPSQAINQLSGQTVDFPTFLSTSKDYKTAEAFIGKPGALMSIDSSKTKQKGIDVLKAKQTANIKQKEKNSRRLPELSEVTRTKLAMYDAEEEMILNPNTKFKILSAKMRMPSSDDDEFDSAEDYYASIAGAYKDKSSKKKKPKTGEPDLTGIKLDLAAQMLNRGGAVQKFADAGAVKEATRIRDRVSALAQTKQKSIQETLIEQLKGLGGPAGVRQILGIGSGDSLTRSVLNANNIKANKGIETAKDYVNRALFVSGQSDAAEAKRIAGLTQVAIAGLLPMGYSDTNEWQLPESGKTIFATIKGFNEKYLSAAQQMSRETAAAARNLAENMQYADIFDGGKLAFDFDETLVSGVDILNKEGKPDIPQYSNRAVVAEYLKRGRLTRLGAKLKTLIDADPEFIRNTRILTARPANTVDLLAQSLQSFGLPYQASDITGVGGEGVKVPTAKAQNLAKTEKLIDDSLDNIRAVQKSKKSGFLYTEPKAKPELDELMGQGNIEGAVIEKALAILGANLPPIETLESNRAIDFPGGLGRAAQFFGLPDNIPTEVKRTLNGSSFEKARGEFDRYYKEQAVGLASGGMVPALVSNGEAYVPPKLAQRIGSAKLNQMNNADRIGVGRFSEGGISVFKGPGSGTSDSIPTSLPEGSFIIRAKATKALGLNRGGRVGVQRFNNGGDIYDVATSLDPVSDAARKALEDSISQAVINAAKDIKARAPAGSMTSQEAITAARQQTDITVSRGLFRAADTGDQAAAKAVADAQRKQVLSIIKQIRSQDKNVTVMQAKAAAEQRVAQAWGGLITKVKQGVQAQQQVNQSAQNLAGTQNTAAQQQQQQQQPDDVTQQGGRRSRLNLSNLGTALAFTGPMLAQQIGAGVGGTAGAGIAGGATAFSSTLAVGAQFGPWGALIGGVAGVVAAFDGYNSAIKQKESELASVEIDKTLEQSVQTRERFAKTGQTTDALSLVNNFQKIQELEQKRSVANIAAEQPGYLSTALNYASFGYFGGDRRTEQEIAGARTAEQQVGAQEAQAFIASMITAGKSYDQVTALLQQKGSTMSDLISAMTEADPAYQADVVAIQKSEMAEELKTQNIQKVKQKYIAQAKSLTDAQFADVARAKASKKLAQQINVVSASITRTFDNLNQAINSSSNNLKQASEDLQRIISGSTGFTANLESLNVLQNPKAFGRAEQNAAIGQASQFAGADRGFVEQLARFSLDAEDIVARGAAMAQQTGANQGVIAENILGDLTKRIESVFGQSALTEGIRKNLSEQITESLKRGEDIDIQKLLEEAGLAGQIDASKQAFDALQNSLKLVQEAMNFAANAANEYGKLQQNLRDSQASYQNTILQSDIALKEALGQRVGVDERIQARQNVAATRAGVAPNQLNADSLVGRRDVLQKEVNAIRTALNNTANSFDATVPKTNARFVALTKRLAETESALKATEQGLEGLPATIEGNINDIIGEIGRIQQEMSGRQQAAAGFAEQLVGSTPQELMELNSTFNLLNNTLNGQITTINQSQAAQQAYFQALQNGSTQQEAYAAAQQAFAGQTRSALGLFNQLTQLSGLEGQEVNTIRADLLENFARSQGMGLQNNPMFQKMLELLRKPPEQSAEIQALQGMLRAQQAELKTAMEGINDGVLAKQKDILDSANQVFIKALNDVRVKFDTEQLRGMGLGLGTPGQATNAPRLSKGGVVYASDGAYVNYQPRGTDTIPAMLSPGEFVVNAQASKNNLGLLRAINSSAGSGKTFSRGGIVYAAGGFDQTFLQKLGLSSWDDITDAGTAANRAASTQRSVMNSRLFPTLYPDWLKNLVSNMGGGRNIIKQLFSNIGSGLSNIGRLDVGELLARSGRGLGGVLQNIGGQFSMNNLGSSLSGLSRRLLGAGSVIGTNLDTTGLLAGDLVEFGLDDLVKQAARAGQSTQIFKAPGVIPGGGLLTKALGPLVGGVSGFMADEDRTNRNRYVNTALGIFTGTGTTMGDVGAQSTLGSLIGAEQGGALDTQLGNWSQFGLTTAQYMQLGLDPATAGLVAAGAMNIQEAVGLYGDRQELANSREKTRRMQDTGRPDASQLSDARERRIVEIAGGYNTYEGRSGNEIAFIREQARLQNQIEDLQAKTNRTKEESQRLTELQTLQRQRYQEQKTASATRNEGQLFVRTGTFRNTSTFDDATIQRQIQQERDYQRREDRARSQVAQEEQSARDQAIADQRSARAAEDARFEEEWKQRQERINRRKAVGLQEWASDKEVEAAEQRQAAANQRQADIATEQNRLGRAMSIGVMAPDADQIMFGKYRTQDKQASDAVFWGDRLPPNAFSKDYTKAKEQRQALYNQIAQERTSVYNPDDPFTPDQLQWEKEKNERLDRLFAELNNTNESINQEYVKKGYDQLQPEDKRKMWDDYRAGKEREEKVQRREDIRAKNRAAAQQASQLRAVAKYANVQVPDKFANPGAFFTWRKNLQKRLSKDIPFGSRTPEAMQALGIGSDLIQAIYEPFNNEQLTAIYSSMLDSGRLSPGASRIVGALRLQKYNLANKIESDPRLQQIISSSSPAEQKAITREFQATFGKSVRQIGVFNQLVNRFSNLNPGQQAMARANLLQRAAKQGLIDPRGNTDFNISRLNALGGGNVASFLYNNQQTQNRAIRVSDQPQRRSKGGIIYASTGMMVPYEPRGTDTVPAMLTPGEFVVNRAATQKHLPLLQSINRSKGGSVKYLQEGGMSTDVGRYIDGVPVETAPDKRIDEVLMNTKESTKLGYINRDNIQTNTSEVPSNNINSQEKLDYIISKLNSCCEDQARSSSNILDKLDLLIDDVDDAAAGIRALANQLVLAMANLAGVPMPAPQAAPNIPANPPGPQGGPNNPMAMSYGGIVYASDGTLVNYQPKGTDTVPAMLTPGEFVINRAATQKHLPLLHAINNGYYGEGGPVRQRAGSSFRITLEEAMRRSGQSMSPAAIEFNRGLNGFPSIVDNSIFPELESVENKGPADLMKEPVLVKIKKFKSMRKLGFNKGRVNGPQNVFVAPWQQFDTNLDVGNWDGKLDPQEEKEWYAIVAHELRHYLQRHTTNPNIIHDRKKHIRTNSSLADLYTALQRGGVGTDFENDYFYDSAEMDVRFSAMRSSIRYLMEQQRQRGENVSVPQNWPEFIAYTKQIKNPTLDVRQGQQYYFDNIQSLVTKKLLNQDYVDALYKQFYARAAIVLSKGGIVYANNGMLVPYQPKGTDTVPAMLTPGEFVVNREATKHNLPMLQAINRSNGGKVSYLANGTPGTSALSSEFIKLAGVISPLVANIQTLQNAIQSVRVNNAGGVSNSIDFSSIQSFTQAFGNLIKEIAKISIPSTVNLQMAPANVNVNINGAQLLQTLQPAIQGVIISQISSAMNDWVANNLDGVSPPNFGGE